MHTAEVINALYLGKDSLLSLAFLDLSTLDMVDPISKQHLHLASRTLLVFLLVFSLATHPRLLCQLPLISITYKLQIIPGFGFLLTLLTPLVIIFHLPPMTPQMYL